MAGTNSTTLQGRGGWATAIALVAYRKRNLRARDEPSNLLCWWHHGGFTVPYCLLASGLGRNVACCMRSNGFPSWNDAGPD